MEQLNKILEKELKDFRSVLTTAAEAPRIYKKESSSIYKPTEARFKLVCWFKDGNTRYFYSYDNVYINKDCHLDEWNSLKKLIRLLNQFEGKYANAIIYANLEEDRSTKSNYNYEILKRDRFGNEKTNKFVNFITLGKNHIIDYNKMSIYGNQKIK